jgi:integrase
MLAVLLGCGLRRGELLALQFGGIQRREEHRVIADLVGKGGHIRTVPMPAWVKDATDAWTAAARITDGTVFRAITKLGCVWGNGMTAKVLWDVVRRAAADAGIAKLAPHDLRRTCARLCHLAGGEGLGDLPRDRQGFRDRYRPASNVRGEVFTVDEFHHERAGTGPCRSAGRRDFFDPMNGRDVGMVQRRSEPRE